jgi:hypothetical protein
MNKIDSLRDRLEAVRDERHFPADMLAAHDEMTDLLEEIAALSATPAPAVDAVPAGEVEWLREALAAEAKDWRHSAYSRVTFAHMYDRLSASLSHGEGRK